MSQTTKQWSTQETYGGKLVENIVQAIARDCLADSLLRIDAAGYNIVLHVHDEIVMDEPNGKGSIEEIVKIMSQPIPWAKGLNLTADGFETYMYKK
jgi:DNA polymerase